MSRSPRLRRVAPWVLLMPFLLAYDDCDPTDPPENDPVITSRPAVLRKLETDHATLMPLIRGLHKDGVMPLDPGSVVFAPLRGLTSAIEDVRTVHGSSIRVPGFPKKQDSVYCGDDLEIIQVLDVTVSAYVVSSERIEVEFQYCTDTDSMDIVKIQALSPSDLEWDKSQVQQAFSVSLREFMNLLGAYSNDHERERTIILGEILGCPEGSAFDANQYIFDSNTPSEYFCVSNGERHGPYVQGHLDHLLQGTRLVEGWYNHGKKHGDWVERTSSGLKVTHWDNGTPVARQAPAAPPPQSQDDSQNPPSHRGGPSRGRRARRPTPPVAALPDPRMHRARWHRCDPLGRARVLGRAGHLRLRGDKKVTTALEVSRREPACTGSQAGWKPRSVSRRERTPPGTAHWSAGRSEAQLGRPPRLRLPPKSMMSRAAAVLFRRPRRGERTRSRTPDPGVRGRQPARAP